VADLIGVFTQLRIRMQSITKMMAAGGQLPSDMMTDDEILSATLSGSGPRPVTPGKVRRKKRVVNASGKGFAKQSK